MATKQSYQCRCGKSFMARVADRNRGWARFCSKSCKATEQEKRTGAYKQYCQRKQNDDDFDFEGGGWDAHKDIFK